MRPKKNGIQEILESGQAPGCIVRGNDFKHKPVGFNQGAAAGRTAEQQEALDAQCVKETRHEVQSFERENKGRHRKDGSIRHVGRIPCGMFESVKRQTGNKNAWQDDPGLLKRTGTNLVDDV